MELSISLKTEIHQKCIALIQSKIETCKKQILDLKEARSNETKSSAGDKFETTRAMLDMELDKLGKVLNDWIQTQRRMELIKRAPQTTVQLGALVRTNNGMYYIAESLGNIRMNQSHIFCLSVHAPICNVLVGLKAGDATKFRHQDIRILDLI